MDQNSYRIGELAEKSGVTKRTIHYYMRRGLLPPSEGAGLGTTYSDEHLYRIMLIKKLQDDYLPLDEIRKRISGMSLQEVIKSLEGNDAALILSEPSAQYGPSAGMARENPQEKNHTKKNLAAGSITYERIDIGSGLELHFQSDNEKAREMAEVLYRYAQKMMKEG
jgi:DNA-binding transcriptional MerR regulator